MGQLLQFPRRSPDTLRVASAVAGDTPLWRASAEAFGPNGPRQITCILVQVGQLELLRAIVQGEKIEALPVDPGRPDPRWGEVRHALLGLWLQVPELPRRDLELVRVGGTIDDLFVDAVLTVGPTGVRSALWTAHALGDTGLEVHGRLHALSA